MIEKLKDLSNENVVHIKKNGIEYLQFRKLLEYSDIINHAYSIGIDRNYRTARAKDTQKLSTEEYNKSIKAYKDLSDSIGINYIIIVKPNQAHTKNIKRVDAKVNTDEPDFNLSEYNETDGLITNSRDIALATTNADCILMLFFDPVKRVIANVHSGWKGTLQKISIEAVKKMKEEYNCDPKDIICCMCPSIRKCHFDVREDVEEIFEEEFRDLQNMNLIIEKQINTDKWKIDTIEINKNILEAEGLKKENIIDSKICSVCNSDLIHSFRTEKLGYGLNTAIIELI